MSVSDVGDQYMLSTFLGGFQYVVDLSLFPTRDWYPLHERFPLSTSSSFAFDHPGQRDRFQLTSSRDVSHTSDLSVNNNLHEILLTYLLMALWSTSLFYTLSVHAIRNINRKEPRFYNTIQYNLLNSSNKRACSNRFVNVTIVVSNNSGQKIIENVKRDKRKLVKHLKKNNLKWKKHTQNKNTLMLKI